MTTWTADELAKMPTYYIMDLDKGMAATVAPEMPSAHTPTAPWRAAGAFTLLIPSQFLVRIEKRAPVLR